MTRRLPNSRNNFLGHGQIVAKVDSIGGPLTIERRDLSTGATTLVTSPAACGDVYDWFSALNRARGFEKFDVIEELLTSGVTLQTRFAAYRARRATN